MTSKDYRTQVEMNSSQVDTNEKRQFSDPKLTFVEPELVKFGTLSQKTTGVGGGITPGS